MGLVLRPPPEAVLYLNKNLNASILGIPCFDPWHPVLSVPYQAVFMLRSLASRASIPGIPCFLCPPEAVFYLYKNLNASIPGKLSPVLSAPP